MPDEVRRDSAEMYMLRRSVGRLSRGVMVVIQSGSHASTRGGKIGVGRGRDVRMVRRPWDGAETVRLCETVPKMSVS